MRTLAPLAPVQAAREMGAVSREQKLRSADQSRHRLDRFAARKDGLRQHSLVGPQVVAQYPLEHGAQIGGRLEIAVFVEIGEFQPRPIGDNAAAL
jgi:hypothetical protein